MAGAVLTGRVTSVREFGAFVDLGGRREGWSRMVAVGMTATFEILSSDPEKKRIGVALV